MRKEIVFIAPLDIDREVIISRVNGNLGWLHIYIDRYFCGSMNMIFGKWVVHWNTPTEKSVIQIYFDEWFGISDKEAILDRMVEAGWI